MLPVWRRDAHWLCGKHATWFPTRLQSAERILTFPIHSYPTIQQHRHVWLVSKARRALHLKICLYGQIYFFQYRMDFTETACVCALLLRIRKGRRKKRHWIHPVVSKRLLNGQFYKLYEDLRNCNGNIFSYFRMSIESSHKLLVLIWLRIIYENYFEFRDLQCEVKGIKFGRNIDIYDFSAALTRCRK